MNYIGIDCGKNTSHNGISVITCNNGKITNIDVMPYTTETLAKLGKKNIINKHSKITIEKVHAFSGQGVVSMFSFGQAFGEAIGCLKGLGVKEGQMDYVSPLTWKKYFDLLKKDKQASCVNAHEIAKKLTNKDIDLKRTPRCKVDSDGMADALLIGVFGMEN